jgi:hypothetical protein
MLPEGARITEFFAQAKTYATEEYWQYFLNGAMGFSLTLLLPLLTY